MGEKFGLAGQPEILTQRAHQPKQLLECILYHLLTADELSLLFLISMAPYKAWNVSFPDVTHPVITYFA